MEGEKNMGRGATTWQGDRTQTGVVYTPKGTCTEVGGLGPGGGGVRWRGVKGEGRISGCGLQGGGPTGGRAASLEAEARPPLAAFAATRSRTRAPSASTLISRPIFLPLLSLQRSPSRRPLPRCAPLPAGTPACSPAACRSSAPPHLTPQPLSASCILGM